MATTSGIAWDTAGTMCTDFPNQRHKHLAFPSNDKILDWLFTILPNVCVERESNICYLQMQLFQTFIYIGLSNLATSNQVTHQDTFSLIDNFGNRCGWQNFFTKSISFFSWPTGPFATTFLRWRLSEPNNPTANCSVLYASMANHANYVKANSPSAIMDSFCNSPSIGQHYLCEYC
jgi:hypothetical protein